MTYIFSYFSDNLMNEEVMTAFIQENFKANLDVIEDLSFAQIKQMVQDRDYVLVYVCKQKKKKIFFKTFFPIKNVIFITHSGPEN